jgi:hypothetical protein
MEKSTLKSMEEKVKTTPTLTTSLTQQNKRWQMYDIEQYYILRSDASSLKECLVVHEQIQKVVNTAQETLQKTTINKI